MTKLFAHFHAAPEENSAFILDGLDLRVLFDQIIGQEDAVKGVLGARAAGMPVVGITTACKPDELLAAGASWVLPDYSALPAELERMLFG